MVKYEAFIWGENRNNNYEINWVCTCQLNIIEWLKKKILYNFYKFCVSFKPDKVVVSFSLNFDQKHKSVDLS